MSGKQHKINIFSFTYISRILYFGFQFVLVKRNKLYSLTIGYINIFNSPVKKKRERENLELRSTKQSKLLTQLRDLRNL